MRAASLIPVGLIAMLAPAAAGAQLPASPADQPPFDGGQAYRLKVPPSESKPPPGFTLDARRVATIATDSLGGELGGGAHRVRVRARLGEAGQDQWQVDFYEPGGKDVA